MTNTDIFSLFNLVDEHKKESDVEEAALAEAKKNEREIELAKIKAKSAQSTETKGNTKTTSKKEDLFTPDENTVIRYYGESLDINTYFTPEELAEGLLVNKKDGESVRKPLEPEMLRKRMEKDFPELVKEHTEIIFLQKKNIIVPTMKAKKKGSEQGLSNDSSFPFSKKIPFSILQDFIAVAKLYGEADLEVHADIYFNKEDNEFFLDIPKQMVHQFWTEVIEDSFSIVERVQDAIKVLEIHSHHSMRPIPTSQDNASERVPGRHYAIVGLTNRFLPELYVRQFISDEEGHITKLADDIFISPFEYIPTSLNSDMVEVSSNEY